MEKEYKSQDEFLVAQTTTKRYENRKQDQPE